MTRPLRPSLSGLALVLVTGLSACAGFEGELAGEQARYEVAPARRDALTVCHGNGCAERTLVAISDAEWREVAAAFVPPPASAEAERAALARAISRLETITGAKAGTAGDRGGTFKAMGADQMDCVDEMVTTAGYLQLLDGAGFLAFHKPHRRVSATFFEQHFWPHTAASLLETATGAEWVVDSWVHDNGAPPLIVPIASWRDNSYRDEAMR